MRNCLTVDVEEWFHVCGAAGPLSFERWDTLPSRVVDTTRDVLDLLDATGVSGTFFVLGWVARRSPHLVRAIQKSGHEVASHGMSHKLIYMQSREEFTSETAEAKALLEDLTGEAVVGYRAL